MSQFDQIRLIVFALVVLFFPQGALADAYSDADTAYERGDYKTAFRGFKQLADTGNAEAQYFIGRWYDVGDGVTGNDSEAVKWYRKAADQGLASAKYNLGLVHADGRGVPQDYVTAYMWFILASVEDAAKARDLSAKTLTPSQIESPKPRRWPGSGSLLASRPLSFSANSGRFLYAPQPLRKGQPCCGHVSCTQPGQGRADAVCTNRGYGLVFAFNARRLLSTHGPHQRRNRKPHHE